MHVILALSHFLSVPRIADNLRVLSKCSTLLATWYILEQ